MSCDMLLREDGAYGVLYPVAEMAYLEKSGEAGHEYAHKSQKDESRPAPYHTVDGIVYLGYCINKTHNNFSPV